jgi:outer membrane protein assembly factor BamB
MVCRHELVGAALVLVSMAGPLPVHAAASIPAPAIAAGGSWTTYHHDNAHTGYDPLAPTAAVGAISPTPGWTQSTLDAEVYAEPLVYNGLVYVATLNNTVYALNQSDGTVAWSSHLGTPQGSGWVCGNVAPMGILGTPVIDTAANRIYAVAEIAGTTPTYRLFGLDLTTGTTVLNTVIAPTGFDWTIQQQRGALALANGYVYVPFGGRAGDCFNGSSPYYGWVIGVPTDGVSSLNVFKTPSGAESVWAPGGVVVDDTSHNVFFATGNAIPCAGSTLSDAVVRVSPTLTSPTFFQPNDWQSNWCGPDSDLGSASPVLISPNLMFTAGKHGGGFLLDPTNLGGLNGQLFPTRKPATYVQADVCFGNTSAATYGSFAYAAPFVYVECEGDGLVALNVNISTPSFSPCDAACAAPDWHAGGPTTFGPPIVAGGAVWVASNGGGLYAFNAATGAQIYHSAAFGINRFVTPAEAGGQVFVPSHRVVLSFTIAPPVPVAYTAVTPVRLMDTRISGGPLGAGRTRNLTVAGVTPGALAGAAAVVLNVTATNTTATSFLTVYPAGNARPNASNLNWKAGKTVPNLVEVPVGAGGAVTFHNQFGLTDVVVDLEGYFALPSGTAGQEVALTPARITDTRSGSGQPNAGSKLGAGGSLDIQVKGAGGVPSTGVSAAVLNVTVTNTTAVSYLTAWPAGATRPAASNLNWVAGQTVPNRVIVPVGTGGKVSVYNRFGAADVIVDVSGYFTDATATGKLFVPQIPHRIADTRGTATLGQARTFTLQVGGVSGVPATASAVILNVTVTNTTRPGFLTVYPSTATRPTTSDLNWTAGLTVPNLVVATLGSTGAISFYNSAGSTDVVVDLLGYFN